MKIYTKTGDAGETSLVGGRRVSKASERVCAYGDLDELISYIALLRCHIGTEDAVLRQIQAVLMTASAHVASDVENPRLTPFPEEAISVLEKEIDRCPRVRSVRHTVMWRGASAAGASAHALPWGMSGL